MAKTLLFTGFEPFGDWKTNPSFDALEYAQSEGLFDTPDITVKTAEVPVRYDAAFEAVQELAAHFKPLAIVHFGLHGGMKRNNACFYIESTARNRNRASIPDNAGRQPETSQILSNAPETISATIPINALCNALQAIGLQARISDDAGGYLCNYLFFRSIFAFGQKIPCGFVHVPPVDTQGGVISLERMANATAAIARVITANL